MNKSRLEATRANQNVGSANVVVNKAMAVEMN